MREKPSPDNFAAQRVHEHLESKVKDNPVPSRSEIVDLMLQQALQREEEIDAIKADKAPKGLQAAQRKPIVPAQEEKRVTSTPVPEANDTITETDLSFFENLLAPPPASNTEKDQDNDE